MDIREIRLTAFCSLCAHPTCGRNVVSHSVTIRRTFLSTDYRLEYVPNLLVAISLMSEIRCMRSIMPLCNLLTSKTQLYCLYTPDYKTCSAYTEVCARTRVKTFMIVRIVLALGRTDRILPSALDLQSRVSSGHDSYVCKRSVGSTVITRNKRTDGRRQLHYPTR